MRTSGATQRGCVMRATFRLALSRANRLVKPKSPIFTCSRHNRWLISAADRYLACQTALKTYTLHTTSNLECDFNFWRSGPELCSACCAMQRAA